MTNISRRQWLSTFAMAPLASASGLVPGAAAARPAAYPARPVRLVVPVAAGGSTDVLARGLSAALAEQSGATFFIDNKPGGSGALGAQYVARSNPDGETVLITAPDAITVLPAYKRHLQYQPERDFTPVTLLAETSYVFVVRTDFPAQDMRGFIALARSRAGRLTFSSAGIGTNTQLVTELLRRREGLDMVHVPYQGSGPALVAVSTGEVDIQATTLASAKSLLDGGRLKALAVTSAHRLAALPQVPTMGECGVSDFTPAAWFGLFVPSRTPASVVERLDAMAIAALATPRLREQLKVLNLEPNSLSRSDFSRYLARETLQWQQVVQAVGLRDLD